jgi:hypothetical protein
VLLNADQLKAMRECAWWLLETNLPYKTGDETYKVICRDYGGHPGTTCGFLCHWLMWRLGVTNKNLSTIPTVGGNKRPPRTTVNRREDGFRYQDGDNISCLVHNPNFITTAGPKDNAIQRGLRPQIGDIVYIYQTDPVANGSDHVFCFNGLEENGRWRTGESGQEYGEWGKMRTDRQLLLGKIPKLSGNTPSRTLMGWLPLEKLDFGPPPEPLPWIIVPS